MVELTPTGLKNKATVYAKLRNLLLYTRFIRNMEAHEAYCKKNFSVTTPHGLNAMNEFWNESDDVLESIDRAFTWDFSPEGYDFWACIDMYLTVNETKTKKQLKEWYEYLERLRKECNVPSTMDYQTHDVDKYEPVSKRRPKPLG